MSRLQGFIVAWVALLGAEWLGLVSSWVMLPLLFLLGCDLISKRGLR